MIYDFEFLIDFIFSAIVLFIADFDFRFQSCYCWLAGSMIVGYYTGVGYLTISMFYNVSMFFFICRFDCWLRSLLLFSIVCVMFYCLLGCVVYLCFLRNVMIFATFCLSLSRKEGHELYTLWSKRQDGLVMMTPMDAKCNVLWEKSTLQSGPR